MFSKLARAEIKDTRDLITRKARDEGVYLTKGETIKDFKRGDIDGDGWQEKIYFISNRKYWDNWEKDFNNIKIVVTKKMNGIWKIFLKKGVRIMYQDDGMIEVKDLDKDGKDEVLFFFYEGAHSGSLQIYRFTNGKLEMAKIGEVNKDGKLETFDCYFLSCVPAIYVVDIDKDGKYEIIDEDRNYGGDPILETVVCVYKWRDGVYIPSKEYLKKYKDYHRGNNCYSVYNFIWGKRKRFL